jgi:hypothetical protein
MYCGHVETSWITGKAGKSQAILLSNHLEDRLLPALQRLRRQQPESWQQQMLLQLLALKRTCTAQKAGCTQTKWLW